MAASAYMLRATTPPFFSIPYQPSPLKRNAVSLNPSLRLPPPLPFIRLSNSNRRRLLLSDRYTVLNCSASTLSPSFPTTCTTKPRKDPAGGVATPEKGPNLQEMAMEALRIAMQAMQAPVAGAVVAVLLVMSNPLSSLAATGGRMGGGSFSSSRSSSSSSYSSSSSSRSSYLSSSSSRSSSSSDSSPSSSSRSSFWSWRATSSSPTNPSSDHKPSDKPSTDIKNKDITTLSHVENTSCTISPTTSHSSSSSTASNNPSTDTDHIENKYLTTLSSVENSSSTVSRPHVKAKSYIMTSILWFFLFALVALLMYASAINASKITVINLQVGLVGIARSLQKDLDKIAENADTSTPKGFHYILTETVQALLRNVDSCHSVYSWVDVDCRVENVEEQFNKLSTEDRAKFDQETLVNVNDLKKHIARPTLRSKGLDRGYIVITILVAARGGHRLPIINGQPDLKDALEKLGSINVNKIMAVEVLWTPQNENDILSEEELLEDYPLLRLLWSSSSTL